MQLESGLQLLNFNDTLGVEDMTLGEKIYDERTGKKITQAKLASDLRVSRQTVSKWEVGEAIPSPDNLKRLAAYFNVPMDYFVETSSQSPSTAEPEPNTKEEAQPEFLTEHSNTDPQFGAVDDPTENEMHVTPKKKRLVPILSVVGMIILIGVIVLLSRISSRANDQTQIDSTSEKQVSLLPEDGFGLS